MTPKTPPGPRPDPPPHATEVHIRRLLETLPAAAYTCDLSGQITYFNRQAVELWGRAPKLLDPVDRFCGSFRLYSPDGVPIAHDQCWMALAITGDREYSGREIVIERPDGERRAALAYANPIRDEDSKLLGAVNVLVDITDRKRAEELQSHLAAIVESSDDAIISKTLDGIIQTWNVGAERIFGHTAEEAIGRSITLIIPDDRLDEERGILARLRKGERIDHYETIRVTKDGRRVAISLTSSPVRDATGRVIGASKVARDITARIQSDEALNALKDELSVQVSDLRRLHEMSVRLSNTLELQPILDETLRTVLAIQGATMGLLALCDSEEQRVEIGASLGLDGEFLEKIVGLPPSSGVCGMNFREHRRVVIEDVESDPGFSSCRESARRAGFRAVHATPLVTRSGKVVGVLSTYFRRPHRPSEREMDLVDLCVRQAVDFIENARLYHELRDADRRKDEFLAILAHELRNPLAPIRNALELLRLDSGNPVTLSQTRSMMERQLNQMVRLVDDLMDASRITRNKLMLRKEQIDMGTVLRSAVESVRPLIEAAGHELVIELPKQPVFVDGDLTRLSQVFANLLNNAAKYTGSGGKIHLTAERDSGDVVVRVRDNGIGIPPEMLPDVFEMFTQVDRSIERSQGGLGIGLSLVRGLVHLHGGTIEARSEGAGRGSEFVVRLPVHLRSRAQVQTPVSNGQSEKAPASSAHRILVVDDNEDSATSLGMMLELMGHEVSTAHDGLEAVTMAASFEPGVVFLDIGLPKLNGYEAARRIRTHANGRTPYLIALTGWGQEEDRRRAAEAGFDLHMVKPLSPATLEELLAGIRPTPR